MAKLREITQRRSSVGNIRKITKTMEMVATARFRNAHQRAIGTEPYTEKLEEMIAMLAGFQHRLQHPLLNDHQSSGRTILLVLSTNRGLCGSYNANILHRATSELNQLQQQGQQPQLWVSGKKGSHYFRYHGYRVERESTDFDSRTSYTRVDQLTNELIRTFMMRQTDGVRVVYTRFQSVAVQQVTATTLLPIRELKPPKPSLARWQKNVDDYIVSPSAEDILSELIPSLVRSQLYRYIMQAVVSEQVVRMRAMKAATDNSNKMIQGLTRQLNRARQTQITNQLLDIIGGSEALQ